MNKSGGIIVLCAIVFSACHKKAMTKSENVTKSDIKIGSEIKKVIIDADIDLTATGASYTVDSITLNGDILSTYVTYSGGCKEHSFDLYSNGMYAKSLPPQVYINLKHINNDDACRSLITQELKFNISPLKHPDSKTVIVRLKDKRINYIRK